MTSQITEILRDQGHENTILVLNLHHRRKIEGLSVVFLELWHIDIVI